MNDALSSVCRDRVFSSVNLSKHWHIRQVHTYSILQAATYIVFRCHGIKN
jgi:hypothetical protein